jgi:two-component system, cell cycle sensor histidine kinase and response regulator CckA
MDALTGNGQRVVVVDDDDDVRQVVAAVLEPAGYVVTTTGDAEAAVAAAQGQVDLLLTDVVLPGTSGTRLADRVERVHQGVPVVFMSGYPSDVLLQRGLVSDDAVVLAKPFSRTDLLEVVAKALAVGR